MHLNADKDESPLEATGPDKDKTNITLVSCPFSHIIHASPWHTEGNFALWLPVVTNLKSKSYVQDCFPKSIKPHIQEPTVMITLISILLSDSHHSQGLLTVQLHLHKDLWICQRIWHRDFCCSSETEVVQTYFGGATLTWWFCTCWGWWRRAHQAHCGPTACSTASPRWHPCGTGAGTPQPIVWHGQLPQDHPRSHGWLHSRWFYLPRDAKHNSNHSQPLPKKADTHLLCWNYIEPVWSK